MAKFINKKEQVYDLQLTSYAKYLLSIGRFKPSYYAFFDDNVLYDKKYAFTGSNEAQNDVDTRIKEETQYLESLVLFRDVEETLNRSLDPSIDIYDLMVVPKRSVTPAPDIFKIESALGDAYLDGPKQVAPAWKVVALQSEITSSSTFDTINDTKIPQLNINANYYKKIVPNTFIFNPRNFREQESRTPSFADDQVIQLVSDDPVMYIEEINTELLVKNFDVEVFEVIPTSSAGSEELLSRKFFRAGTNNVQNNFLVSNTPTVLSSEVDVDSVDYYFSFLTDFEADQQLACRGASSFDKSSFYIDLDFDCDSEQDDAVFYDIYGEALEPEICEPEVDPCQD